MERPTAPGGAKGPPRALPDHPPHSSPRRRLRRAMRRSHVGVLVPPLVALLLLCASSPAGAWSGPQPQQPVQHGRRRGGPGPGAGAGAAAAADADRARRIGGWTTEPAGAAGGGIWSALRPWRRAGPWSSALYAHDQRQQQGGNSTRPYSRQGGSSNSARGSGHVYRRPPPPPPAPAGQQADPPPARPAGNGGRGGGSGGNVYSQQQRGNGDGKYSSSNNRGGGQGPRRGPNGGPRNQGAQGQQTPQSPQGQQAGGRPPSPSSSSLSPAQQGGQQQQQQQAGFVRSRHQQPNKGAHHPRYHQQRRGQQQEWSRQRRQQQGGAADEPTDAEIEEAVAAELASELAAVSGPVPPVGEDEASLSDFTKLCQALSLSADRYPEAPEELEQVFGGGKQQPPQGQQAPPQQRPQQQQGQQQGQRPPSQRGGGYQQHQHPYQRHRSGSVFGPDGTLLLPVPPGLEEEAVEAGLLAGMVEEVLAPMETLGLRKRSLSARQPRSSSSSAAAASAPASGGRRGSGRGDEEEDEEDEMDTAEEDEEASDDEDLALSRGLKQGQGGAAADGGGGGAGGSGVLMRDKRVVSSQIKDAKLTEYIKDKKKARSSRDRFLADTGLVRSEVHPPQRFIEVYYNAWADDFYTAITTSSASFGPRWWFREALGHEPPDVMAWVRQWRAAAAKHGVLHEGVAAVVDEALALGGGAGQEEQDPQLEAERFALLKVRLRERREPKVIAIGDVHGCIEEARRLIKKLEYSPGDLIVFLGDMVAKGPESVQVIRLAREIGALSVRGNHENEVIRWSRALALGAQSNFKSEHYLIATGLDEEDIEWLRNLPWYISCSDLQLLFVHAGFVANQRLSKQHPRFMINMRSILADGTVSARYYQDYPWARTWQGPQTVLFGHDARRGMQVYDAALGLDTGCVYGGNLTACVLPGKELVQVAAAEPYIVNRYDRIMKRAQFLQKGGDAAVATVSAAEAASGASEAAAAAGRKDGDGGGGSNSGRSGGKRSPPPSSSPSPAAPPGAQ